MGIFGNKTDEPTPADMAAKLAPRSPAEAVIAGMRVENTPVATPTTRKAPEGAKPPRTGRPGEEPPKDYIGTSRGVLNKTLDTYHHELALLDKDIAKLTEERRQLKVAIAGLDAALMTISDADTAAVPTAHVKPVVAPTADPVEQEAFAALEASLTDDDGKA